jgi:hypothetical protein
VACIAAVDPTNGIRFLVDLACGEARSPAMVPLEGFADDWCMATAEACVEPDLSSASVVTGAALPDVRSGELAIWGDRVLLSFRVSRALGRALIDLATGEVLPLPATAGALTRVTRWRLLPFRAREGQPAPAPVYSYPPANQSGLDGVLSVVA